MKNLIIFLLLLVAYPLQATRTLVDQNQRTVTLPENVNRLITFPIPLASMVMAIDGSTQWLVGMNQASRSDISDGLLGVMFPAAANIPANIAGEGFAPNVESVAAARPDMVFQWGDRGDSIIAPLRQLGLPVVTINYGDSRNAAHWLRLVAGVLGKPQRGEQLAGWFTGQFDAIEKQTAALDNTSRPRVIYLYRVRSGLQVAGKGSSMDSDIRRTGGNNMAAQLPGFATVNIEQLLAWDPQIILLNNFEADLQPAELYADPRLASLSAIQQRRVYTYPRGGFRWEPPSQESPLTLQWLLTLFHPGLAAPEFRRQIKEAYQFIYGYSLSEAQTDQILRLDINGQSADYCRRFCQVKQP